MSVEEQIAEKEALLAELRQRNSELRKQANAIGVERQELSERCSALDQELDLLKGELVAEEKEKAK